MILKITIIVSFLKIKSAAYVHFLTLHFSFPKVLENGSMIKIKLLARR